MSKPRIGIIGAGLMGVGIAQAFAEAGHDVDIYEPDSDRRGQIVARIKSTLTALGKDPAAARKVRARNSLERAVILADVVIEAVPEDLDLKQRLFRAIEAAAPAHAIFASNTSVIPITRVMAAVADKSRALGAHWWNPPYQIPLVEVVPIPDTAETVVAAMMALLQGIGKTAVLVRKDVPGFIGNRLQHALWREAIALVQNGVCDAETVDAVVKASFGRRLAVLGPLENADLVGTDLTLAVHEHVMADLDRTPGPLQLLRDVVAAGRLGMKTGAGFRTWTEGESADVHARLAAHLRRFDDVDDRRFDGADDRPSAAS